MKYICFFIIEDQGRIGNYDRIVNKNMFFSILCQCELYIIILSCISM